MKKLFNVFMVLMTASFSTCFVSCGGDDEDLTQEQKPVETVLMGRYSVYFPEIKFYDMPELETGVAEKYQAYQKTVTDALKVDQNKLYKWSEIEADKERLQKAYDGLGNFEYSVKSCGDYTGAILDSYFRAYEEGKDASSINFGTKKLICKLDVPADATCQLRIDIVSYEKAVPSAKEYTTKVKNLFVDALKDVFTEQYYASETSLNAEFKNMMNYSGDRPELLARVKKICDGISIPEVPAQVKEDAKSVVTASGTQLPVIFKVKVTEYDLKAPNLMKASDDFFTFSIPVK